MAKKKIIECVPNFSEGRDPKKIKAIAGPFSNSKGVKLLDCQKDKYHNRMVVTAVGSPDELKKAVLESVGKAAELIDMKVHGGQHPRMGAADVIPFIPVKNVDMEEVIEFSKLVARKIAEQYRIPVFLYEESAAKPERKNLANVRKGQFEGMAEKIKRPEWKPDFGPSDLHASAGATAVGARMPLVAFNVNLDTRRLEIAEGIAKKVRHTSGGFRYCKGIGIEAKEMGVVQVSMNMTDYKKTALYRVFEMIGTEADRYGVGITGSEIVGLVPMEALIDSAAYYLRLNDFSMDQVLETRIME